MVRVLHEEPAFSEFFVSHLLTRTIRVEADLVDQLFNSSENACHVPFYCWRILARKANQSRPSRRSAKKHSRR